MNAVSHRRGWRRHPTTLSLVPHEVAQKKTVHEKSLDQIQMKKCTSYWRHAQIGLSSIAHTLLLVKRNLSYRLPSFCPRARNVQYMSPRIQDTISMWLLRFSTNVIQIKLNNKKYIVDILFLFLARRRVPGVCALNFRKTSTIQTCWMPNEARTVVFTWQSYSIYCL